MNREHVASRKIIGYNKHMERRKGGYSMELITAENRGIAQRHTLNELNARFIAYLDAKPRTIETYSKALRPFFTWLAERDITQPQRADIIAYRDSLSATLKPSSVRTYLTTVKLFFKWAVLEGLYPVNPAEHVKGPLLDKNHKKDALTTAQAKTILESINRDTMAGKRDYAVMALMTGGGLRCIEVARADIEDIGTAGDSTVLFLQGKGRDEKTEYVKLAQPIEAAIREYLKARGKASGPLFASASNNGKGQRMTTRAISGIVKGHFRAAGFDSDKLTAHSLRHTAATLALLNGATYQETQQLLRHSSLNTTMIYVHNLERAANTSEGRIAAALFA